jgi:serine phosphatase RsbU (regulator of sigma subunit)
VGRDPVDLLNEPRVALVADQIVAEARTVAGVPAALYVVDLDGRSLHRVAGDGGLPDELDSVQVVGPEIPAAQADAFARSTRAVCALPLMLRGRALSVLAFAAPPRGDLDALAARGAAALELAERYTDVLASGRRHRECSAAAELQQDLLPPRIARLHGANVAGSILPAYDVGGDWIDHSATAAGGWLGLADAVGKGPQASAIGAIALGAYRGTRRSGGDLAAAARHIHETICALEAPEVYLSAILATWDGRSSSLAWLRCGHPPPLTWHVRRGLRSLEGGDGPVLGLDRLDPADELAFATIAPDELLVLVSDGVLERVIPGRGPIGEAGLHAALDGMAERSATAAVSAVLQAVAIADAGPLRDDASVLVLEPR